LTRALAFRGGPRPRDFGSSLSRLRWRRAVTPDTFEEWDAAGSAKELVGRAPSWVVVLDESALPISGRIAEPERGTVRIAQAVAPGEPAVVHTLRELESALASAAASDRPGREGPDSDGEPAALAFRSADFPPAEGETVDGFLGRLASSPAARRVRGDDFRVLRFEDPSERERPELTRRLAQRLGSRGARILDVGCGAGGGIGAARERHPAWVVTGIERDPSLAQKARTRCSRVIEADLVEAIPRLAAAGERFDAIVLADVVEHLEDPIAALASVRDVAADGSMLLASVPNAGHLSIVRDLLCGRFDPVPAGLCDAGHLRWLTRGSLRDWLEEAGWRVESIEGERGAPAPDAEEFLRLASAWPEADQESLRTYQWIAVALRRP